ncbi:hypothetical protein KMW28_09305 [Flammeovirga yaeyamensis]|uniref:Bestrophin, RFP-TM, chloride channel n=1 Tax=Flammeovirga yaeyamensis TaxID=367791 RepID=A0AAX1NDJ1_9BACT|nr:MULTISPECIES: bestrophin family ion channel [Flammeovirga]ANQ48764.1 hypothetical protein MY04_1388 [Flammeovirga sp. MY04]MBB3698844.1 putative membrane protein [Flammeovirga yaeyamensis]NMF37429.1 hypothetical protein [Flammeovirga yaeyamensis]QWG03758.1 hypothetical protein KMW28_09305 [Flammeovirga yaeyamensis]
MPKKNFSQSNFFLIFSYKGYLIRRLAVDLIWIAIPTTILCTIHELGHVNIESNFTLPGLMGAILGILLVFRNNTAYDRWWEARKVLGGLVNTSRNYALQINQLLPDSKEKTEILNLIAAFPYVLKEHLRSGVIYIEIEFVGEEISNELKKWEHVPNGINQLIIKRLKTVYERGEITDFQYLKLIENSDELIDIMGKCERIHKTPMPQSHNYLLKAYIYIYAIIMPLGLIENLEWWTIPAVIIIYYVAMSIVTISEEIEDPFGKDPNDLPVDNIANNIYKNIQEIINK